jgi:hypothetical protein
MHRVLHKRLHLFAYKVQITQELKPDDKPERLDLAIDMLHRIYMDPGILPNILFSDEATFYQPEKVNRYNASIWGSENPHIHREVIRDGPKVNVRCGLMKDRITGPFSFVEATVTGGVSLDMLEQFVYPQVADLQLNIIYQQDGAPPNWSLHVRETLTRTFPIVGLGGTDQSLGPRVRRISLRWISFSGGTSGTECMLPVCLTFQRYETASVM